MCSFINHTEMYALTIQNHISNPHTCCSHHICPVWDFKKFSTMPAGKQQWQNNLVLEVTTMSNTSCTKSRFGTVGPFVSALLPLMTPIKVHNQEAFLGCRWGFIYSGQDILYLTGCCIHSHSKFKTCGPPARHGEQWKYLPKNIPLSVWAQWAWLLSYKSRTNKSDFVWPNMAPAYKTCLTVFISNVKRFRENVLNIIVEPPNNTFSFHT
jgi:hypothetical protein